MASNISTSTQNLPVAMSAGASMTRESLNALKIPDLKNILKSKGLKVGGNKQDLIDRILATPSPGPVSTPASLPSTGGGQIPLIQPVGTLPSIGSGLSEIKLPPLSSLAPVSTLPPVASVSTLPPVASVSTLPPVASVSTLTSVQLPPLSSLPPVSVQSVSQGVIPLSVLSPEVVSPITSPGVVSVKLPPINVPVPPVNIQAAISPLPAPIVNIPVPGGFLAPAPIISGLESLPTELPIISVPTVGATPIQVPGIESVNISLPPLPTVIPSKSVKLPSLETLLPVVTPIVTSAGIEQGKVGPGGLPIQTDLSTLTQMQKEVHTAVNINPAAAFQKKIPAPAINLPPISQVSLPSIEPIPVLSVPSVKLPTISTVTSVPLSVSQTPSLGPLPTIGLPVLTTKLETQKPLPVTSSVGPLTTGSLSTALPVLGAPRTDLTQPIQLPKVKATAPIPDIQRIQLPIASTVMKPVPLTSPAPITQRPETGLAVAYTPEQEKIKHIMNIDPSRLSSDRAKKDDTSYSVADLRTIAGTLNLAKSGNKKDLVERIKAEILKVNPNAFNK